MPATNFDDVHSKLVKVQSFESRPSTAAALGGLTIVAQVPDVSGLIRPVTLTPIGWDVYNLE